MNRRAFTIIEWLVTIGIIALLMALLIPAVMAARESARRLQCHGNLAQFGLAMHNHDALRGHFPSALLKVDGDTAIQFAPHVYMLPFIEQSALYNRIDLDGPG